MEEFSKYPKIRRANDYWSKDSPGYSDLKEYGHIFDVPTDEIVIQEKIDGANFRFMITDDGSVVFGSRNNEIGTNTPKNFKRAVDFVKEKIQEWKEENTHLDLGKILGGYTFFAEGCWKHSTSYDWNNMPIILGFDVKHENSWVDFPYVCSLFDTLDIPFVPIIKTMCVGDILPFSGKDVPISVYSHNQAEGIMIKNYTRGTFAKYVTEKHQEESRKSFGGKSNEPFDIPDLITTILVESDRDFTESQDKFITERLSVVDGSQYIIDKYCTNTRIDKFIFKLLDGGDKLGMALMQHLPKLVHQDIYDEYFEGVYKSKKKYYFDFGLVRRLINNRCKTVLRNVIENAVIVDRTDE